MLVTVKTKRGIKMTNDNEKSEIKSAMTENDVNENENKAEDPSRDESTPLTDNELEEVDGGFNPHGLMNKVFDKYLRDKE